MTEAPHHGDTALSRAHLVHVIRVSPHAQVLEEYVKLFDMRDKTFVEALRAFLKEFRLPGEVQQYVHRPSFYSTPPPPPKKRRRLAPAAAPVTT